MGCWGEGYKEAYCPVCEKKTEVYVWSCTHAWPAIWYKFVCKDCSTELVNMDNLGKEEPKNLVKREEYR